MLVLAIALSVWAFRRKISMQKQKAKSIEMQRTRESSDDCDYDSLDYEEEEKRRPTAPRTVTRPPLRRPSEVPEEYVMELKDQKPTNVSPVTARAEQDNAYSRHKKIIKVNDKGHIYTEFGVYLENDGVANVAPQEAGNADSGHKKIIKINEKGDIYTEFGVYVEQ